MRIAAPGADKRRQRGSPTSPPRASTAAAPGAAEGPVPAARFSETLARSRAVRQLSARSESPEALQGRQNGPYGLRKARCVLSHVRQSISPLRRDFWPSCDSRKGRRSRHASALLRAGLRILPAQRRWSAAGIVVATPKGDSGEIGDLQRLPETVAASVPQMREPTSCALDAASKTGREPPRDQRNGRQKLRFWATEPQKTAPEAAKRAARKGPACRCPRSSPAAPGPQAQPRVRADA